MIKAVILGTAHMHCNEIALYIAEQPETELVGVADLTPDVAELCDKRYTRGWNLQNIAATYGTPVFSDYEKMLDETKPDVAYILCENGKKPELVTACARRGVDVVIEKPMAVSLDEARKIREAVDASGIEAYVNWPVVWRHYVLQLKAALDAGLIGEPIRVRYLNGHTGPLGKGARHRGVSADAEQMTDEERAATWWHRSEAGGGAYLDICCYGCLYTAWLLGAGADSVLAYGANLNTPVGDTEDNAAAIVSYPGKMSVIEATWTTPNIAVPSGPMVVGTEGVICCEFDAEHKPFLRAFDAYGKEIAVPDFEHPAKWQNMPWQYAAHKLRGEAVLPAVTLPFNLNAMAMLDAVIRAAESGEKTPVPAV